MIHLILVSDKVEAINISNPKVENGITTWDCVYFGNYLQGMDANGDYKREPIKWRVLSVDGDTMFLLADSIIDSGIKYNEANEGITWAQCTIRSWLNGYDSSENRDTINYSSSNFIDAAFSTEEKNAILETVLSDSINPKTGNNTVDKVFLLSSSETKNSIYGFTDKNKTRIAIKTTYALEKSPIPFNQESADGWWLRTEGFASNKAKFSYKCYQCNERFYVYKPWSRTSWYSSDYNFSCNPLYKNKTKITLKLDEPTKGGIIKLKIGKKIYTKKITTSSKTVVLNIKKHSYGSKISGTLYYNGKGIGTFASANDYVWYANKIKKGMTKTQVKYTRTWGAPKWTSNRSNGWTYWLYKSGSYVGFKNGKVKTWCVIK